MESVWESSHGTSHIYTKFELIHMGNCRIDVNRIKLSAWCDNCNLVFDNKEIATEHENNTKHKISRTEYVVTEKHYY
jgi:hypothetical protein